MAYDDDERSTTEEGRNAPRDIDDVRDVSYGKISRILPLHPAIHPSIHLSILPSLTPTKCPVFLRWKTYQAGQAGERKVHFHPPSSRFWHPFPPVQTFWEKVDGEGEFYFLLRWYVPEARGKTLSSEAQREAEEGRYNNPFLLITMMRGILRTKWNAICVDGGCTYVDGLKVGISREIFIKLGKHAE